jgi:threonine/homoserine/homoserine lactone efflux protein
MTLAAALSLLIVMLILAAIPSSSVALVVGRSAAHGFANGAAAATGIVLGDLLFVAAAIFGLESLAEAMGSLFLVVRLAGGAYLIWFGISLLRHGGKMPLQEMSRSSGTTLLASFTSGFFLTLGDVKAILFYASLFPAVVDLDKLTPSDIAAIISVTVAAVGGVKLAYAWFAEILANKVSSVKARRGLAGGAGCCMIGAGTYVILKG